MPDNRYVRLEWLDLEEAENVAAVFEHAAIGQNGQVRDHGFWDDAQEIRRQVDAIRSRQVPRD